MCGNRDGFNSFVTLAGGNWDYLDQRTRPESWVVVSHQHNQFAYQSELNDGSRGESMSLAFETCAPVDFVVEAQTCRDAIEPALRRIVTTARERGWSHQQIHLALFEIAIASIKTEKLDIATLVRLRRAAWCATPMD